MKITQVSVLDKILPCAGRNYCIGRITDFVGSIPDELGALIYPEGKERLTSVPENAVGTSCENMGAMYIFLDDITKEDDTYRNLRIVESVDDFLSPFDLPEEIKKEFAEFFFGVRAENAGLSMATFELEDNDDPNKITNGFCFYSMEELAYISDEGTTTPTEMFDPNKLSSITTDTPIQMLFAQTLEKGVDVFNRLHYYDKAKEIAELIKNIEFINEMGEKSPLNITAVEKLISNIKDNIRIR